MTPSKQKKRRSRLGRPIPSSWGDLPDELSLAEAAAVVRVHYKTFANWRRTGATPAGRRVGKAWYFSKSSVRRWYLAGKLGRRSA